jgi:hypothetical protein
MVTTKTKTELKATTALSDRIDHNPNNERPKTVTEVIADREAKRPPAVEAHREHVRPPKTGPPKTEEAARRRQLLSPKLRLLQFKDLQAAGVVRHYQQLRNLIDQEEFPVGRWVGKNTRAWTEAEIEAWLAKRPTEYQGRPRVAQGIVAERTARANARKAQQQTGEAGQ